jgi:subtilisin family serine protease
MNAWNITTGSASVAVAVLDMGIDTSHPDLRGKIDRGFNTIDGSSTVTPDATGHGTFCAGLIGAATNNSSQLAAIGWDTHVVPIKMAQYNDSDVISAIDWVRTNKAARIINMSFAGTGRPTQALIDAVNRAWAANIVLCASSGENNGSITPHYPAAMKPAFLPMAGHVVGVAGCNVFGRRFLNNNYGSWCDIAAPAQDYSLAEGGGINIFAGSSVACPVVCAVIALMVAANPHLTNAALVDILLRTGKPVTADFGMPSQPAVWIDAYSAVREAVAT